MNPFKRIDTKQKENIMFLMLGTPLLVLSLILLTFHYTNPSQLFLIYTFITIGIATILFAIKRILLPVGLFMRINNHKQIRIL